MRAGQATSMIRVLSVGALALGLVFATLLAGCSVTTPGMPAAVAAAYTRAEGVQAQQLELRQARDVAVLSWSAELDPKNSFSFKELERNHEGSVQPHSAPSSTDYGARGLTLWQFYLEDVERREQRIRDDLAKSLSLDEVRAFYDKNQKEFSRQDDMTIKVTEWADGRAQESVELRIDASNVRMLQEGDDAAISGALNLDAGQQTTVARSEGNFAVIECLSRKDGGVEPFDTVVQAAASQLATQRFAAELQQRLTD